MNSPCHGSHLGRRLVFKGRGVSGRDITARLILHLSTKCLGYQNPTVCVSSRIYLDMCRVHQEHMVQGHGVCANGREVTRLDRRLPRPTCRAACQQCARWCQRHSAVSLLQREPPNQIKQNPDVQGVDGDGRSNQVQPWIHGTPTQASSISPS